MLIFLFLKDFRKVLCSTTKIKISLMIDVVVSTTVSHTNNVSFVQRATTLLYKCYFIQRTLLYAILCFIFKKYNSYYQLPIMSD